MRARRAAFTCFFAETLTARRGFVTCAAPGSLAADDEAVWRHLTLATFTVPLRANPPTPGGWRGLYKCAARGGAC